MSIFFKKSFFIILAIVIFFSFFAPALAVTDGVSVGVEVTAPSSDPGGGGGGGPTYGCTDSTASNFTLGATIDNGSCQYLGCTDPTAINYNASAQTDNNSCLYEVPNVTNLTTVFNQSPNRVTLTWQNPEFTQFAAVRIVKKVGGIPSSPTDGEVVYDSTGQATNDFQIVLDSTHFYSVFVRSNQGLYSSGVIDSILPLSTGETGDPADPIDPNNPDDPILIPPVDPNLPVEPNDPFKDFPIVETNDPVIDAISVGDFIFIQPGEKDQYFNSGETIVVKGDKTLTVLLPYDRAPEVLKTIGMTMFDPEDPTKSFSFLLRINSTKTAYTATLGPLLRGGEYRFNIYLFNFSDQTLKKINGKLEVASTALLPNIAIPAVLKNVGQKAAVSLGLLAIIAQTIGVTTHLTSLTDFYLLLLRLIGALLGFIGVKKRNQPWGTVYDSVTKRPIDPAYVLVKKLHGVKEVSSAITDIDGRYGFFLPSGIYLLEAQKTHYKFPSSVLSGKTQDELYNNLYFGDPIILEGEAVVNKNIPLDPIGFDWNEFTKSKSEFFKIYSKREIRKELFFALFFSIGLIVSLWSLIMTPSVLDVITVSLYVVLFIFQKYWAARHRPIQIKSKVTNEPIPFSVVRFYLEGINTEIKTIVTDGLGRFYSLLRPGEYYYTIEEKQSDGSYTKVFTSSLVNLRKGIITEDILV